MAGEGTNLGTATGYIEIRDNIDTATAEAQKAFDKAIKTVSGEMNKFGKKMQDAGRQISGVGTSLLTLSAPLIAAGGAALAFSIEFESAFANVEKTVDGSEQELADLQATLREMATGDTPLASLDNALITLTNIAAMGGSLGIATDNLDEFVTTVALLDAASDDLDADTAATFIGQFANVTKLPVDEYDNLADAIVKLGNGMATTEGQITAFATRLSPLANYKWETKDIIAYSAALASLGVSPELGGTNLLKTIQDLTEATALGGPKLEAWAKAAGMSATEFKALADADPEGAFNQFLEGLSKMDADEQLKTLKDLGITSTEQITTIQRLAGGYSTLTQALGLSTEAWTKGGDALTEAEKKADTAQGNLNKVVNKAKDLALTVGSSLTPALNDMLDKLGPIIDDFADWAEKNPELVGQIAAVSLAVAGLGLGLTAAGVVFGAVGTIISGFSGIIGLLAGGVVLLTSSTWFSTAAAWAWQAAVAAANIVAGLFGVNLGFMNGLTVIFTTISGLAATAAGVFGAAISIATGPVGLIALAIGGLIALLIELENRFKIIDSVGYTLKALGLIAPDYESVDAYRADNPLPESPRDYVGDAPVQREIPGGAKGGYTGDGPANEIAGFVHKGEFIIPQDMLRAIMANSTLGTSGRKVAENINIYANSRDEGYAAAMGFEEEVGFALRS